MVIFIRILTWDSGIIHTHITICETRATSNDIHINIGLKPTELSTLQRNWKLIPMKCPVIYHLLIVMKFLCFDNISAIFLCGIAEVFDKLQQMFVEN